MRHWGLLFEADEALRALERRVAANPADMELRRKLVAMKARVGIYTPVEGGLHHAGLDHAEAVAARLGTLRRGAREAESAAALKRWLDDEHRSREREHEAKMEFARHAKAAERAGLNPLLAIHRHPGIETDRHIGMLVDQSYLSTGPSIVGTDISDHKGRVSFSSADTADLFERGMRHHYGETHEVTRSTRPKGEYGGMHRVDWKRK